jgi:8-oxo-dGTP diphosphatase
MSVVGEGSLLILETTDGRIAAQLRDDAKYGGYWGLFGGWLEPGERPDAAALREAEEELSITLDPAKLKYLTSEVSEAGIRAHLYHYPITDEMEHAELREGTAFQMMTPQELWSQEHVIPFHVKLLQWYWTSEH